MPAGLVPFFYDGQIRRFMLQFARAFSNYQVEEGRDQLGNPILVRIPVMYGNSSRQAADIIAKNSQNNLPSAPQMTFYITAMDYARDRIQDPTFVGKVHVRQRAWDAQTQTYETTQGAAFTVERLMPVPYDLTINLDIWTSNQQQKEMILEQILTLFNPSIEIQSTDNYLDWTSLSTLELTNLNFSSRTVPVGGGNPIDISTLTFKLPVWISAPAKVKKLGVIQKIIANIYDAKGDANDAIANDDLLLGTRRVITWKGYQILLLNGQIQCLTENTPRQPPGSDLGTVTEVESSDLLWRDVIAPYGNLVNGISQVRLSHENLDTEIVGTVSYSPADDRLMLFTVDPDTLPQNTLVAVDAVINPTKVGPGHGLPLPVRGVRYLLTADTGNQDNEIKNSAQAWTENRQQLIARANDIIEYTGQKWEVSFDSAAAEQDQFVTNLTTNIQYKYDPGLGYWAKSYEGYYRGGDWSLVI